MNENMIRELFKEYVTGMQDEERHTDQALNEEEALNTFLEQTFSDDSHLQDAIYDLAMGMAVEFEEDGFIAGFKAAAGMFSKVCVMKGVA